MYIHISLELLLRAGSAPSVHHLRTPSLLLVLIAIITHSYYY